MPRLALRDLARNPARSAAALASISLALGISSAIVIAAAPAPVKASAGNLPADQLIVGLGNSDGPVPVRTAAQIATLDAAVKQMASAFGEPSVIPLDVAVDASVPALPPVVFGGGGSSKPAGGGRGPVLLAAPKDGTLHRADFVNPFVATPALLAHFGLTAPTDASVDALVSRPATGKGWEFVDVASRGDMAKTVTVHVEGSKYSSLPTSFVTTASIERHGWATMRSGWLIDASKPFTRDQLAQARKAAAAVGLTIEARRVPPSNAGLRTGATAVGAIIALVVLALSIGLIRSEATADLRTLTATGATSSVRRALTATTAAALALLGIALGTFGAYVALASAFSGHLDRLRNVPVAYLIVTFIGLPLIAAAGGWLLAGREPDSIAREIAS